MTTESASAKTTTDWPTLIYFGLMTTVAALLTIAAIPIQYIEKNTLSLTPAQISNLSFIVAVPAYLGFLAGMLRDRWKPFGLGDRAYFFIFAPLIGLANLYIGHGSISPLKLVVGLLAAGIFGQMFAAAQHGLASEVGKRAGLSGSISTVFNVMAAVVGAFSLAIGGMIEQHLSRTAIFDIVAVLCASLAIFGIWQPRLVAHAEELDEKVRSRAGADLKRLFRSKPLWLAVLINFMWNFAPGTQTATFFFLTNHVHLTPPEYGDYNAVFSLAFLPTLLAYGVLCRKFPLRRLLWVQALIAVPQVIMYPLIDSFPMAIAAATFAGLTGGGLSAAIWDLTLRVAPKGIEGTAMLLVVAGNAIVTNGGDIFGSWLFAVGGYFYCVATITFIYVLIVPVVLLVPKSVTEEKELEPIERVT